MITKTGYFFTALNKCCKLTEFVAHVTSKQFINQAAFIVLQNNLLRLCKQHVLHRFSKTFLASKCHKQQVVLLFLSF